MVSWVMLRSGRDARSASGCARWTGSGHLPNVSDNDPLGGRASRGSVPSRTNADDRLALDPLGRVQGGDGVIEGRDVADVRPQPTVPDPLDDLTQLSAIGLDDEVDRQAVGR